MFLMSGGRSLNRKCLNSYSKYLRLMSLLYHKGGTKIQPYSACSCFFPMFPFYCEPFSFDSALIGLAIHTIALTELTSFTVSNGKGSYRVPVGLYEEAENRSRC